MTRWFSVTVLGVTILLVCNTKVVVRGGSPPYDHRHHHDDPPPLTKPQAAVNRHVLLQIHATVVSAYEEETTTTFKTNNHGPPFSDGRTAWILTMDELEQADGRSFSSLTNPPHGTPLQMDKELFLTWQPRRGDDDEENMEACTVWHGTANASLALPLLSSSSSESVADSTRTLIVALWHHRDDDKNSVSHRNRPRQPPPPQRTLLARQVVQMPRTVRHVQQSLATAVYLEGRAPHLETHHEEARTSRWWWWTAGALVTVVFSAFGAWQIMNPPQRPRRERRQYEYRHVVAVEEPQEDHPWMEEQQRDEHAHEYEQEDGEEDESSSAQQQDNDEEHWQDQAYEDDDDDDSLNPLFAHGQEERSAQAQRNQDDPNDDLDNGSIDENQNQADNPQGPQVVLENLPPAPPITRRRDDDSSSASSLGPARPPVMERYVIPGITSFEAEMEHFKQLQLGSPQSGSRSMSPRRRASPGVTPWLAQPTLTDHSGQTPQRQPPLSFASFAQQQQQQQRGRQHSWTLPLRRASVTGQSSSVHPPVENTEVPSTREEDIREDSTWDKIPAASVQTTENVPAAVAGQHTAVATPADPPSPSQAKPEGESVGEDYDKEPVSHSDSLAEKTGAGSEHTQPRVASVQNNPVPKTEDHAIADKPPSDKSQDVGPDEDAQGKGVVTASSYPSSDRNRPLGAVIAVDETETTQPVSCLAGNEKSPQTGPDARTDTTSKHNTPTEAGATKESTEQDKTFAKKSQQSTAETTFRETEPSQSPNAFGPSNEGSQSVYQGQTNSTEALDMFLVSQKEESSVSHVANLSQPSETLPLSEEENQSVSRVANLSQYFADSPSVVLGLRAEKYEDGAQFTGDKEETSEGNGALTSHSLSDPFRLPANTHESTGKEAAKASSHAPPNSNKESNAVDSTASNAPNAKKNPSSNEQAVRHSESMDPNDSSTEIPRVTPPYEKPLSGAARGFESAPEIDARIKESLIADNEVRDGTTRAVDSPAPHIPSGTGMSSKPPGLELERRTSNFSAAVQSARGLSQGSQDDADRSSTFTYVSTLSPDSRASSSNWTDSKTPASKDIAQSDGGDAERTRSTEGTSKSKSGRRRRASTKEGQHQSRQKVETAESIRNSSSPSLGRDNDEVEVTGVRQFDQEEMGSLPEVALSSSLRNATQNLEAPVWQFSNEEALKPVARKRRRKPSRRRPAERRAPFMSPASNTRSAPRPETKRKLVDLTDFKTPPLQEPAIQAKRRATGTSPPPPKSEKDPSKRPDFTPPPPSRSDPVDAWSNNRSAARGSTFSRRKRPPSSDTKPAPSSV